MPYDALWRHLWRFLWRFSWRFLGEPNYEISCSSTCSAKNCQRSKVSGLKQRSDTCKQRCYKCFMKFMNVFPADIYLFKVNTGHIRIICENTFSANTYLFKVNVPVLPSYRNQSIDLLCKSIDWFLHEGNTGT